MTCERSLPFTTRRRMRPPLTSISTVTGCGNGGTSTTTAHSPAWTDKIFCAKQGAPCNDARPASIQTRRLDRSLIGDLKVSTPPSRLAQLVRLGITRCLDPEIHRDPANEPQS